MHLAQEEAHQTGATQVSLARPSGAGRHWFALRVRSSHEKVVSRSLESKGYAVCDAMTKCKRTWSDRIKEVDVPLFPGYVFCRFDPMSRLPIVTTPNVISVVGLGGVPEPVKESEMEAVQVLLRSGRPVQAWPFLQVGARVRFTQGALKDVEGILTDVKSRHRLVVSVTLLQRSVAVEVEDVFVRPDGRRLQG